MIYTLTTNPAIDMNISTNGIKRKLVNRTSNAVYSPNGKGLNVTFVLGHYGIESKILGFFGGFSGKYIVEESEKRGFDVLPTWVEDTTRINIFLNDGSDEFKFVNSGSYVNEKQKLDMLDKIQSLEDISYLSISGSLPPGIDDNYYEDIFKICENKSIKTILDISSPKLKELLQYNPYLIKPNDEEIKDIFGIIVRDEEDIKDVLKLLHLKGAQNILLTLGEKGSYFYNGKSIYYASAQPVTVVSSACAGDSALAAFLSIWLENPEHIEEALKRSAATGASVAESNGIGNLENVEDYIKNISAGFALYERSAQDLLTKLMTHENKISQNQKILLDEKFTLDDSIKNLSSIIENFSNDLQVKLDMMFENSLDIQDKLDVMFNNSFMNDEVPLDSEELFKDDVNNVFNPFSEEIYEIEDKEIKVIGEDELNE